MLPKLVELEDKASLIANSGLQFLDFGLQLDLRDQPGAFARHQSGNCLVRLEYDEDRDRYYYPGKPGTRIRPLTTVELADSAALLDGHWLPVPVLRFSPPNAYATGPTTWARLRVVAVDPRDEKDGPHTHRATLAVDTAVANPLPGGPYLAPGPEDLTSGAVFHLATRADHIGSFPEIPWVDEWLQELFAERAERVLKLEPEEIHAQTRRLEHQAHYLNLLALVAKHARIPEIKLIGNRGPASDTGIPAVPVDLILDLGNSRTCGILVEQHPQEEDSLARSYQLGLRDLSRPHLVHTDPFESRLEFAEASFGKAHIAHKSGRADAFRWPTIARIGPEAASMAARRRGTEGATGLSSPKRYLWDLDPYTPGWRFSRSIVTSDIEPNATAAPLCNLVSETGACLWDLPPEEQIPVIRPRYARSFTLSLLLTEVLAQALSQINSPAQRLRMPESGSPRYLRTLVLTVPPSMPKTEREIFHQRAEQAVALLWKSYGWHPALEPLDASDEDSDSTWPPMPRVETRWDEATCAQTVFLFSEIQNSFAGDPESMFSLLRRPSRRDHGKRLTLATIDIGGGTTDLVINDYALRGTGSNVSIVPEQRFRDGFRIAGDDVLLDCIRYVVVPAIEDALQAAGATERRVREAFLGEVVGTSQLDVQESVLRQQFTLQVLYPAGLAVLKRYEAFDPVVGAEPLSIELGMLLREQGAPPPTDSVTAFFQHKLRMLLDAESAGFDVEAIPVRLDIARLHELFLSPAGVDISRPLDSLCEVVHRYECDLLILTGRPSRLPGVRERITARLPLPPHRIVCMDHYHTGAWYPFHQHGNISDPKTTAAVGAMLCTLGQGRLHNFYFRANELFPYSTIRYLGFVDRMLWLRDENVYYQDIDLDSEDYQLPETYFPFRGKMRLGYRQIAAERWTASPLYVLDFANDRARKALFSGEIDEYRVRLQRARRGPAEMLVIADVQTSTGRSAKHALEIRLNTLASVGAEFATQYWLDSGIVYGGV